MSQLAVDTRDMDEEEARLCVDRIRHHAGEVRHEIQRLHDRMGWRALGYPTWDACVESEFTLERSNVFKQLKAAQTEAELNSGNVATQGVPTFVLYEVAKVPEPEERLAIAREVDLTKVSTRKLRETIKERRTERVRDARREMLASASPLVVAGPEVFEVFQADCGEPRASFFEPQSDLIVTSPPYGLSLEGSDQDDDGDWGLYLTRAATWAYSMYLAVNAEHGRICLNIPLDRSKGSREAVYADWVWLMRRAGWKYEATIVWKEGNTSNHQARGSVASPNAPHAVAPVEMVLVMYRGEWALGAPSRPSDIAELDWVDWLSTTWTFAGEHRYRVGHMAPFPEELARRLILLYSFPGALIGDPFVGSGTTAVAALKLGRRFRGSDIDPECVALTRARVAREVVT